MRRTDNSTKTLRPKNGTSGRDDAEKPFGSYGIKSQLFCRVLIYGVAEPPVTCLFHLRQTFSNHEMFKVRKGIII